MLTRARRVLSAQPARAPRWSSTEAQGGATRARALKLGVVLLTAVIFTLSVAVTINLKHTAQRATEAEVQLQALTTELRVQDGLEYRLISGRRSTQEVRKKLAASRALSAKHLEQATNLGLSAGTKNRIVTTDQIYSQALDEEVRLLSLNESQKAFDFDVAQLDPAFDQMTEVLLTEQGLLQAQARTGQSLSDAAVLLTGLLSLALVSLVQSRRRRAKVRSQAERRGEARYRTLIDQSSDLVAVVDRDGHAHFLSPSVERLLGSADLDPNTAHAHADPALLDFVAAIDPQDRARFATILQTAAPGSESSGEFRLTGRHGTAAFQMTVQDLIADPSVGGLVLTGHDVTESLELHHEMEHRALHDTLTGLPNRALLADRFEQALRGAKRQRTSVALLLLDLDRFKEVNDTFGHHYGDELLRQIGPRLSSVLRGVDTIARLGGDEFAVLLPDVHRVQDATDVAAELLAALAEPFHVEGVDMDVEASVGVVISGLHGNDPVILMQRADIAMYVAKTQHVGVFVYSPNVDGHSAAKLALVGDLRRALSHGELVLYYQPKVSIDTGDLVGAEALVRWQHPVHGLVFPDDFIPLAERTGLINPLTRHILDIALAQARVWLDAGRPLPIAVNLSARNLHDENFAEMVAELLACHDVPPHLLDLEVTESAIMIDPERARLMLEKLSALGVRISLDDFGAGYTSLSQLTSMPIDEIKIDRWFVMTMADDPSTAVIVQSVVDLGHNLGLTLVAEGVETAQALKALAGFGCDVAQGYHMSRPIPVADFDAWCAGRPIAYVSHKDRVAAPAGTAAWEAANAAV